MISSASALSASPNSIVAPVLYISSWQEHSGEQNYFLIKVIGWFSTRYLFMRPALSAAAVLILSVLHVIRWQTGSVQIAFDGCLPCHMHAIAVMWTSPAGYKGNPSNSILHLVSHWIIAWLHVGIPSGHFFVSSWSMCSQAGKPR